MKLRSFVKKPSYGPSQDTLRLLRVVMFHLLLQLEYWIAVIFRKFYGLFPLKVASVSLACVTPDGVIIKGNQMSIVMRNDQEVSFTLSFADKFGNPVTELGGVPAWSLSDDTLASLTVSEDGMSATVVPLGPKGSVLVNMLVDRDPDEDYEELAGQAEIAILSGKATVVRMSGVISDIPEAATPAPEPTPEPAPEPTPEPAPVEEPAPAPAEEPAPADTTTTDTAATDTPADGTATTEDTTAVDTTGGDTSVDAAPTDATTDLTDPTQQP